MKRRNSGLQRSILKHTKNYRVIGTARWLIKIVQEERPTADSFEIMRALRTLIQDGKLIVTRDYPPTTSVLLRKKGIRVFVIHPDYWDAQGPHLKGEDAEDAFRELYEYWYDREFKENRL